MKSPLYELIHSLSKSEKRYFVLFCTREASGGNYLKLFNAIDTQAKYDEAAIKKRFRNEVFVRQLHVTKNYLFKLILKSLRNYHASLSKDAELKDLLRNVEILYNKELYHQCGKELHRANIIAVKHELYTGKVEIESWKRKLTQAQTPHDYESMTAIISTQKTAIDALQSTNDQWRVAINVTNGMYRQYNNISVRNVRLKMPAQAPTLEGRVLQHNTQYLLDLRNEDNPSAERRLTELITLLEEQQERITEEPGLYVSTINNLLSFYAFQHRHDDALTLIRKAKSIYESWKITAANRTLLKQILRTYNIELELYRDTKSFNHQLDFIESTEKFVNENLPKIPKDYLVSFWFQLASIHFMRRNYGRSLEWINHILNARFKSVRADLYVQAMILNLMIHLDQQNLMVLRYYVDSTKRYMKKVKYAYPYLDVLLKFFVRMGRLPVFEYKQAFKELKSDLYPEGEETLIPKEVRGYIDFKMWIAIREGRE